MAKGIATTTILHGALDKSSKPVERTYQAGDKLLLALADRLRAHSGRLGALARLGGDQFALVQADIDQPYEAAELAQSILDDLEAEFALDHELIRLRATIGITLFPEDGDSTEKLLQKAEQTMTLAKSRSRNRYQFYIASVDSEMRRARLANAALSRGAITLADLQPISR